jgi:hypothetical protein
MLIKRRLFEITDTCTRISTVGPDRPKRQRKLLVHRADSWLHYIYNDRQTMPISEMSMSLVEIGISATCYGRGQRDKTTTMAVGRQPWVG